jgi:hypothetical protein
LPSEEKWFEQGYNHGPWRSTPIGVLLFVPILIIPAVTLLWGTALAFWRKRALLVLKVFGLGVIELGLVLFTLLVLYWTID